MDKCRPNYVSKTYRSLNFTTRSRFCYAIRVKQAKYSVREVNALRLVRLLMCACFVLGSISTPAFSVQKILHDTSVSKDVLTVDMKATDMQHHETPMHHHHAGGVSSSPCPAPACEGIPDCNDNCSISTCCSSPSVSNAITNQMQTDHRTGVFHRPTDRPSFLSRRSKPLFRPPIG